MEKLLSEPLVLNDSRYELCIYTFTGDVPARDLLKETVQRTGYYARERCTMKGTRGRIVYDRTEKSTLRSSDTFMSLGYADRALARTK